MAPLFNILYIGFLDSRIKCLEAEQSKDEFYLAKCAIDAEIDAVNAKIRRTRHCLTATMTGSCGGWEE